MLQQTTVAATIPYYERFLMRFPTVQKLAAAQLSDVLAAWEGLGYSTRARNLHACARAVVAAGGFPRDLVGLRALPGIGQYTAAAVCAIAFGVPTALVDGNVERVVARLNAVEAALPKAKPLLRELASRLGVDPAARDRPSDFALIFSISAPRSARRPGRPARYARGWRAVRAGERGSPPSCRARRLSGSGPPATACTFG